MPAKKFSPSVHRGAAYLKSPVCPLSIGGTEEFEDHSISCLFGPVILYLFVRRWRDSTAMAKEMYL